MNWVSEDSKLLDTAASFLTVSFTERERQWLNSKHAATNSTAVADPDLQIRGGGGGIQTLG